MIFSLVSCKSAFDPNTKTTALVVGELVGAYLLRKGDAWAEEEKGDGDVEWKDTVADLYLFFRENYKLSSQEENLINDEVSLVLQHLLRHDRQQQKK